MIELLEHNKETYERLCNVLEDNNKCALVQATGTGKSYIAGKYIEEHANTALILVPTNAIADAWNDLLSEIKQEVDIVTYQAFAKEPQNYLDYDLVISDEMHHLGSDVWGKKFVETYLQGESHKIIGLTATEIRYLDNSRDMAEEIFENIRVDGCDLPTAINTGVLPTFKYVSALYCDESDFDEWKEKAGKIKDIKTQTELKGKLDVCIKNMVSVKQAVNENLTDDYKKIIVFLNNVESKETALEMFRDVFPTANFYDVDYSKQRTANNEQINSFKSDSNRAVLFAVDMLNEGIHIKGTDCVIMFRKTVSPQVYLQQLGRGLASGTDKMPIIFDFVANVHNINAKSEQAGNNNIIQKWNKKLLENRSILVKSYISEIESVLSDINERIRRKPFTIEEDYYLKENYGKLSTREMSENLGREVWAIQRRLLVLGISHNEKSAEYTEEEINFLKENYGKMSCVEMGKILGRTPQGVNYKCVSLGIANERPNFYSKEEDDFIKENYKNMAHKEIAEVLGRTWQSVGGRIKKLNLERRTVEKYTEDEDRIIIEEYGKIPTDEIAKKLNKTAMSINQRARRIGVSNSGSRLWTDDEENFLKKNYSRLGALEISKILNRSKSGVLAKASSIGITTLKSYSEFEDNFIKENWGVLTSYEIAEKINRPRGGVCQRARALGIAKNPKYSSEELFYIKENYGKEKIKDIAEHLNRTPKSVSAKISEMKLDGDI